MIIGKGEESGKCSLPNSRVCVQRFDEEHRTNTSCLSISWRLYSTVFTCDRLLNEHILCRWSLTNNLDMIIVNNAPIHTSHNPHNNVSVSLSRSWQSSYLRLPSKSTQDNGRLLSLKKATAKQAENACAWEYFSDKQWPHHLICALPVVGQLAGLSLVNTQV